MRQTDKEYAEAMFALAAEEGVLLETYDDMQLLRGAVAEDPEYLALLFSPAIPLSERLSVVDEAFSGRICDHVVSFLKLLCEKGRATLFLSAAEEFGALCRQSIGVSTATVTSAAELDGEQRKRLIEKLESVHKTKIDPVYKVDPSLIGGLCVEIDGKVYDGTVKSRLRNVKEVMMDDATR